MLPKAICKFSAILINMSVAFFTEIEQKILKFAWNYRRIQTVKAIMREKNKNHSRLCASRYEILLQSYGNKDSTILA